MSDKTKTLLADEAIKYYKELKKLIGILMLFFNIINVDNHFGEQYKRKRMIT